MTTQSPDKRRVNLGALSPVAANHLRFMASMTSTSQSWLVSVLVQAFWQDVLVWQAANGTTLEYALEHCVIDLQRHVS